MATVLRLIFVGSFLLCANPAWAVWQRVTETDEMSLYIAPSKVTRKGNYLRFWQLANYKTPDRNGDRSARVFTEFDCSRQRFRSLQWAYFRGPMGSREMTAWRTRLEDWMKVAPGTLGESIGKLVCER